VKLPFNEYENRVSDQVCTPLALPEASKSRAGGMSGMKLAHLSSVNAMEGCKLAATALIQ